MTNTKPPLILLHGALGSANTLTEVASALYDSFTLFKPDLPGHGMRSGEKVSFTVPSLVEFLHDFIHQHSLVQPFVFGYSLGGYIALADALRYPDDIGHILTLGTKFHWDPEEARKQLKFLDADIIMNKVPALAEVLQQRHGETHWKSVLSGTGELMMDLGIHPILSRESVRNITLPVCIALGSEDQMVTQEESHSIARSIPHAEFRVQQDLPHAIEKIPGEVIAQLIRELAGLN